MTSVGISTITKIVNLVIILVIVLLLLLKLNFEKITLLLLTKINSPTNTKIYIVLKLILIIVGTKKNLVFY